MGNDATLQNFYQHAGAGRILHLSTHGFADKLKSDFSYLAFATTSERTQIPPKFKLFVNDLYNIRLNADLVMLSACETGLGGNQPGEGIISLARAFAWAGAKSIAPTLWSVQNQSTSGLVVRFYQNWASRQPKGTTLSAAKRGYLHAGPSQRTPTFGLG